MTLAFHTPTGPLAAYVANMVFHEGYAPPHPMERFLPDGGVELVIDYHDSPKYIFDQDTLQPVQACRRAWVSGMRTRPITITAGANSCMLVVVFHPFGAHPVFGVPLSELKDTVLDAASILGPEIESLRERTRFAATPQERFKQVENWIRQRLARRQAASASWGLARFAVDWIRRAPSMMTIDAVARSSGASNRHLIATFRQCVGTTPKQYQRVLRFQRVIETVEHEGRVDWTAVALDCGFYDQAHLIRDFKEFSGLTPGEYLAMRGKIMNYLPVG